VWDRELRQELEPQFLLNTLVTLSQILTNAIEHPEDEKYRKLPATNKRIVETVLDKKGGKSFLIACGFVRKPIDGKDFWYLALSEQTLDILRLGLELIDEKKNQAIAVSEAEKKRDQLEKEKNSQRAAIAKQQFEEDRTTWQQRLEMTGGTKESVAQPFRDLNPNPAPGPGLPGIPGGVHAMPHGIPRAGGDDDDDAGGAANAPAPVGGHVLGD